MTPPRPASSAEAYNENVAKRPTPAGKPKKRNIIARDAEVRTSAGPMKDKRKLTRQEQKVEDERRLRELRERDVRP